MTTTTRADVAEGVRAAIAAYTQALYDGRTDDVVAMFCVDGSCDIPGMGTLEGHDALRAAYSGWEPRRPQRHLVLKRSPMAVLSRRSGRAADQRWMVR